MSAATPMDWTDRAEHYAAHPDQLTPDPLTPDQLTPRQLRRLWHKEQRAQNDFEPVDVSTPPAEQPKGHPTPRRGNAIEGKRALRRFAEVTRARKAAEQAARG